MSFPLHEAVRAGDLATVRTIIAEKSINANEENENGYVFVRNKRFLNETTMLDEDAIDEIFEPLFNISF